MCTPLPFLSVGSVGSLESDNMDKTQQSVMSVDRDVSEDTYLGEKQGTVSDAEHMRRMGKEQVFKVRESTGTREPDRSC